jgi:imidazoleglycerol-phosphate dehydratase / histidinol-phosphatase
MKKVLFIDRDGTLIEEPPDEQVDSLEKLRLTAGVIPALLRLRDRGWRFVMVTNQDGLGTEAFPRENFELCQQHMLAIFRSQGIEFDRVFVCPHDQSERCDCRKPRTGLLTRYLAETALDLERSAVVGDREADMELARNIGVRGMAVGDGWSAIADALTEGHRRASVERTTRETAISVTVDLDREEPVSIATGIGFFDHMLEQVAKHGGFALRVECRGDLEVDEHHTVEDTAICIGNAVREALGDRAGIGRYGFLLPMDESEAQVALDLSGRAYFTFDGRFDRETVGGLPTELVPHFFRSFAESAGAAMHVKVRGENAHHMVEACFKAVGRALRSAIRREGHALPSTKGMLG